MGNPDFRTFEAALKRIQIVLCLKSKLQIRWTKNRTPLQRQANDSNLSEDNCAEDLTAIPYLSYLSPYKVSILLSIY